MASNIRTGTADDTRPSPHPRSEQAAQVDAAVPTWPSLALNSALIPGGLGFELDTPVTVAGVQWSPADGHPFASPIGVALAAELAGVS